MLGTILALAGLTVVGGVAIVASKREDTLSVPPRLAAMRPIAMQVVQPPVKPPSDAVATGKWSDVAIPRQDTVNPWPIIRTETLPDDVERIVLRVWIATDHRVADDHRYDPRCGLWTFYGSTGPGTTLIAGLRAAKLGCGPLNFLNVGARITINREVEVRAFYPGDEHTGEHRGRKYDVVWTVTPA